MTKVPLSTQQVAERFNQSDTNIHRMIEDGRLKPIGKLPGKTGAYLFDPDEIERIATNSRSQVIIAKPEKGPVADLIAEPASESA